MGKVPAPAIRWRGAHPNNFTYGRPGGARNGQETFHHVVGTRESAVIVFNQPTRGASSHFVVGADIVDQCVNINDTAWCDGNWDSNLRAITVEHEGGQNGTGPYSEQMYERAAHLCAWLRENYGINHYRRHREVSTKSTACPGGLDVERIWRRSAEIIAHYNAPVDNRPQWLKDRKPASGKVYAQADNVFLRNLNAPANAVDSRRFAKNTDFELGSYTIVGGVKYWITKSSTDTNAPNGMREDEFKTSPVVAPVPVPPKPPVENPTPDWVKGIVDLENKKMYVIRPTPLIDLENGHPYVKDGKETWFQAGDPIEQVSASTIINGITYFLTEFAYGKSKSGEWKQFGNGINSKDLSMDPLSTPPGTPSNPDPLPTPEPPAPGTAPTPKEDQDAQSWLKSVFNWVWQMLSKFKFKG